MRVLHVVSRSQRRGAELVALELARELDVLGHQNRVVALGLAFDGTDDPTLPPLTRRVRLGVRARLGMARRLRIALHREPADVLLAHGGTALEVAVLARRGARAPLIVWQRILGFPSSIWQPMRRRWWRLLAKRVDAAVALAPELHDELRRLGYGGPVWPIPNFRNPTRFVTVDRSASAARLRREIGVADDVALIGFVGHLIEQKRPERALDVLARVRALGVPAHLVVAGNGPLRPQLERAVHERGLSVSVHLLGHRDDVERVYGGVALLLITSDTEAVPGVAIEAQMTACPVVTFAVGAVSSVVADGETGAVVEGHDPQRMAESVVHLLRHPELRSRLGEEGRRRAARFASSAAAHEYATRLEALVDAHANR